MISMEEGLWNFERSHIMDLLDELDDILGNNMTCNLVDDDNYEKSEIS